MTIQEALDRVDRMKPNNIEPEEKINWLSKLDQMIWNELYTRHVIPAAGTTITGTVGDGWWGNPLEAPDIVEHPSIVWTVSPNGFDDGTPDKPTYNNETDPSTELLVESPYDDLYPLYLASRIDQVNQEYDLYANNSTLYNNAFQTYADFVHRTYPQRVMETRWRL